MHSLQNKISINVNNQVYLKSPESSALGKRIIEGAIELIDDIGFEDFNFKKLALFIASTEASVYRYFECKHNLLVYLVLWYWGWLEYKIVMRTLNIDDPSIRLKRALGVLTQKVEKDSDFSQINEVKLQHIVISESSKIYLSKTVDKDNELGFFMQYKDIVERLSQMILEINPGFKYPHMLISTVIEGANHQRFFAEHLPRLTDKYEDEDYISTFYQELVFKEIAL